MGNTNAKPHPRPRNKKQVHWKAADRPAPPGKPVPITTDKSNNDTSLTIRWDQSSRDGGSPLIGYMVEYRRYGASNWLRAAQSTSARPETSVQGLEPGWRYQFRVFAENAVGMSEASPVSDPITVMFQKSAITAPRFLEELRDTVGIENDKIEFVVHFVGQPAPKVAWYKDGFEMFSSRRTRILAEADRSVLVIHQSAMGDEGEIKCTITNRVGHATTRALLTLEAPPSIRLPRQYEDGLLFELGETMRLKVSIAGRPAPLVFWSLNGESIRNGERYEVENGERTSVLRVGEARRTDRGEYQIKAVNKLGEDVASFLVTVTDRPSPPGRARVVMTLGRSVTLSWRTPADDGGCKIGNYIIEYFRIGWNVWLKAATTRQLSTILGDLIEGSEYKFRVKAESPYGVSEPSEESETVFIPDPKRGLLAPPIARSRSQPRDDRHQPPPTTPARRKRSQSSTRHDDDDAANAVTSLFDAHGRPIRPERVKTKSVPSTPEMSPRGHRKTNARTLDNQIFDRASMVRELAYGSPEIKVKRVENRSESTAGNDPRDAGDDFKSNHVVKVKERSRSPSPMRQRDEIERKSLLFLRRSRSPSPSKAIEEPAGRRFEEKRQMPVTAENLSGSTEFMLVLYPELQGKGQRETSVMSFDADDVPIPPPLSLSAPELGIEPPPIDGLKLSASSTELLHDRAMIRFYEEAAAEEAEIERIKRQSTTTTGGERKSSVIPRIQINSRDDEDIVGLETKHSLRRRLSAGGAMPQQVLWAQRRHSLRNSNEFGDVGDTRLYKFPSPLDADKIRRLKEAEARKRRGGDASVAARAVENVYDEVEGTDYEEMAESENEHVYKRYEDDEPRARRYEEEDETYHPRAMTAKGDDAAPFEILSKPNKLPDPNFVPKPILKKRDEEVAARTNRDIRLDPGYISRERSRSLAAEQLQDVANVFKYATADGEATRQRSYSLIPAIETMATTRSRSGSPQPERRRGSFSALAETVANVAAGIVMPSTMVEKKKDAEEAKVVVDHYSDIVNTYNQQRKTFPPSPQTDRKKSVNNIFSVRQVQKQHSVDEDSYEKLLEKLKSDGIDTNDQRGDEGTFTRGEEATVEKPQKVDKNADNLRETAEDAVESEPQEKPLGMWDKAMGFFSMGSSKANEDVATQHVDSKTTSPTVIAPIETSATAGIAGPTPEFGDVEPRRQRTFEPRAGREPASETRNRRDPSSGRLGSRSPTRKQASSGAPSRSSSAAPVHRRSSPVPRADRKSSASPSQSRVRKSTPSPSMMTTRKSSPSPVPFRRIRSNSGTSPTPSYPYSSSMSRSSLSRSPSPISSSAQSSGSTRRAPMMKEIMTQTSNAIDPFRNAAIQTAYSTSFNRRELMDRATVTVKNLVEYVTDLVLVLAACYLYLFGNELTVIPILGILIYRQLRDAVKARMPNWMQRKRRDDDGAGQ